MVILASCVAKHLKVQVSGSPQFIALIRPGGSKIELVRCVTQTY